MKHEIIELTVPVALVHEGEYYCIITTPETEKMLGDSPYSQGKTQQEAIDKFWYMHRAMQAHYKHRAKLLDRWMPFEKGDWKNKAGKWFKVFGINVYFRIGKGMQHGWYMPFTKLNIMVSNYWKHKT
jgi:hypothetical protein